MIRLIALLVSLAGLAHAQISNDPLNPGPVIYNGGIRSVFSATAPKQVSNTIAETSAVPTAGIGSMTIPANSAIVGRKMRLRLQGTYQTPTVPGSVMVRIKLGSVTIASVNVTASILAANSTLRELYGEAVMTYYSVGTSGTMVCDGYLSFEIASGVTTLPFSTAATIGTPTSIATVNTTTAALLDVTEQWSNAQAGQGTTIVQATLEGMN